MPRRHEEYRILKRRVRVAKLYCEGYVGEEIAEKLEVSTNTVRSDLVEIRALWLSMIQSDFNEIKSEQLAKIDHLESEAWKAWHESKEPAKTEQIKIERSHRVIKQGKGEPAVVKLVPTAEHYTKTTQGRTGDPRFLQIVDNCIDRRLKLLGLMDETKVTQVVLSFDNLLREHQEKIQQAMADPIEERIVLEHQQSDKMPEQVNGQDATRRQQ